MSDFTFTEYQVSARRTALYPEEKGIIYTTLGLVGESGEIAEKVKKVIRDRGVTLKKPKKKSPKNWGMSFGMWPILPLS